MKDIIQNANPCISLFTKLKYLTNRKLDSLAYLIYARGKAREALQEIKNNLVKDLKTGDITRTIEDHYSEKTDGAVWAKYKEQYLNGTNKSSEVVFRAEKICESVQKLIDENLNIKQVFNFGSTYGWLENQIASANPNIQVRGFDRREETSILNNSTFSHKNLEFVFGYDIFEYIEKHPEQTKDALFIHPNIGVYFLPSFLNKLYNLLHAGNVCNIIIWEPSGISRISRRYYEYSNDFRETEVFRGVMLLNNYPYILKNNRYAVNYAALFKPPHPHEDYRSVHFCARRI